MLELLKHLWGDDTTFYADERKDGDYTCKKMVYAKMFYDGVVLFYGGMASPLDSGTAYKYYSIHCLIRKTHISFTFLDYAFFTAASINLFCPPKAPLFDGLTPSSQGTNYLLVFYYIL